MTRATRFAAGLLLMLWSAAAAPSAAVVDVSGPWTMSYTTQDGVKLQSTVTLKVDGDKLSGTISSARGSVALTDGTINGDDIMFAVVRVGFGDSIRIEYTGKVKGDTMTLKMKAGPRDPLDVAVKRG